MKLTEGEAKAKSEALQKASEIYLKHSALKRKEEEMNAKFDATQSLLQKYNTTFYKDKKSLEQDYKTYVDLKRKTESELQEQKRI